MALEGQRRIVIPIDGLLPGPVVIPALDAVGLELVVLPPEAAQGVVTHSNASSAIRETSPGPSEVVLAVRHSSGVRLEVRSPTGRVSSRGHTQIGGDNFETWAPRPPVDGPFELVVEPPPWAWSALAHTEGPDHTDRQPPDWDAAQQVVSRLSGTDAAIEATTRSLRRVEEHWPDEVPHHQEAAETVSQRRWDRQVLIDVLAEMDDDFAAALDFDVFVPAARALIVPDIEYDTLPVGVSHMHGFPDLPDGFDWPTWDCPGFDSPSEHHFAPQAVGDAPLTFVAQFNLTEVPLPPAWPGPRDGWLVFFVDEPRLTCSTRDAQHAPGAHAVMHIGAATPIEPRVPPWDVVGYSRAGWRSNDPEDGYSFIGHGWPAWLVFDQLEVPAEELLQRRMYELQGSGADRETIDALREAISTASRGDMTYLGGAANSSQDAPLASALHGTGEDPGGWMQLFQVASDARTRTYWGDAGQLHVFIRRDDLAAGRFDRTRLTLNHS